MPGTLHYLAGYCLPSNYAPFRSTASAECSCCTDPGTRLHFELIGCAVVACSLQSLLGGLGGATYAPVGQQGIAPKWESQARAETKALGQLVASDPPTELMARMVGVTPASSNMLKSTILAAVSLAST